MKILFVSSNPKIAGNLQLDEEYWEIRESIAVSKNPRNIFIQLIQATKINDVTNLILKEKPDIFHFSGHGNEKGEIIFEDNNNNPVSISPEKFASMFQLNKSIKCVILNCCYSNKTAKYLTRTADCVIGVKDSITHASAIKFASAFYLALGQEHNLEIAFDFAISELSLKFGEIEEKPELFIKCGINPWETYIL